MASSEQYLRFILDQLSDVDGIDSGKMMGEYILYIHGKVLGGIYDNRLLIKPVPAAVALMPEARYEAPYPGAKEMLLVDAVDDARFLAELLQAMEPELPLPKPKKH